jgi:hypothetical protein
MFDQAATNGPVCDAPKTPKKASLNWPLTPPPTAHTSFTDSPTTDVHAAAQPAIPPYFAHLNRVMDKPLLTGPMGNVPIPLSRSTSANPPALEKEPLFMAAEEEEEESEMQMVCPPPVSHLS